MSKKENASDIRMRITNILKEIDSPEILLRIFRYIKYLYITK